MNAPVRAADITATPVAEPITPGESFVARVGKEQERYLQAFAEARKDLDGQPGQLAAIAAVQGRLTRQFFDAQRSLLRRRAETDRKVVEIAEDAQAEAVELLATARTELARAAFTTPPASFAAPLGHLPAPLDPPTTRPAALVPPAPGRDPFLSGPVPVVGGPRPANGEIAALGAAAVVSGADADALQAVVDEAFAALEPDGAAAERQLRELLDSWWRAERDDERAALDDATARAAMHLHLARIRAAEIGGPRRPVPTAPTAAAVDAAPLPPPPAPELLPEPVAAALAGVDHTQLDAVLASLLDDWAPSPVAVPFAAPVDAVPVSVGPPVQLEDVDTGMTPEEAFESFWGHQDPEQSPRRRWIFPQLLVPAATVVVVLAVLMLLIG
ncbi:MAG: hypothetical protein MUE78_08955, partial [Ilumatobacteraceae bacterium]|nr:hypothetical protein [Ilumatobacteraceae bacterium]